jgi:hypothetical protein
VDDTVFILGLRYDNNGQWEVLIVMNSGTVLAGHTLGVHGIGFHGVLFRKGDFIIVHFEIYSLAIQMS